MAKILDFNEFLEINDARAEVMSGLISPLHKLFLVWFATAYSRDLQSKAEDKKLSIKVLH